MKKWLNYENFWIRNGFTFLFFFGIMRLQEYLSLEELNVSHFSILETLYLFFPLYGLILFHNILLIKNLLFKKKYLLYLFSFFAFLFVVAAFFYFYGCGEAHLSFYMDLSYAFFVLLIGSTPFFMHTWISENMAKTRKELFDKKTELTFLKHQISPHFLFNSLNNLYGTSLAEPEMVSNKILELSDLLRYQIESTKIEWVELEAEMEFMQKYLEYIHFKANNLKISHTINGQSSRFIMPPLLLLPLLENAVKYATESDNPFIEITWNLSEQYIIFEIKNACLSYGSKIKGTKTGLENLLKRLEIVQIKHLLTKNLETTNEYHTSLKIWKTN